MGDELFAAQLPLLPIPARQAVSAEMQFARNTDRHRIEIGVENQAVGVGNGAADRKGRRLRRHLANLMPCREGGVLCRAINMKQLPGRMLQDSAEGPGIGRLPAGQHDPRSGKGVGLFRGNLV